jgi:hypothetical protein
MKNITIIDLARAVEWKDVKHAIKYHYPDDKNNYEKLFGEIKKYRKIKQHNKEFITVSVCGMVNMLEEAEDNCYSIQTDKFSLSFRSWKVLARMPIAQDTLDHYLYEDILAHFIWEITFYGNEEKMNETAKGIAEKVIEIKKNE